MKTYEQFKKVVLGKGFDIDGAYGPQCLANGTLVHMADGTLTPVENLKVGDRLQGWNLVVSNEQKNSQLIEVKTDCGTFEVTPDHRFIDQNGKEIKNLSIGQCVQLDTNEFKNDLHLSADELRFLGFYMGDGTKKYRWKGTTKPEIFVTVGTDKKIEYLKSLNMNFREALHSNKKAKLFYLKNSDHEELVNLIHSISGKKLPLFFTREQYQYIIEGYLNADGYKKNNSFVATSTTKELLVSIQHGCVLNGWRAILSKPCFRQKTNYCDHPKPLYKLTVNKNKKPTGKVISIRSVRGGMISVLNTNGDHTYYAENHKHHNCWDGAMYYSQWLGYPVFNCTVTGYAQDIWTQRNTSGILQYYDEVELLEAGDIVVFKEHPSTPYSHIAIFDHDLGNGQGAFLGQNQGAPNMVFNIIPLPYDATYKTAFRPKCFSSAQNNQSTPSKPEDGRLYGIDLSVHNGLNVNFARVAQTNDFVIIRAGFGWSTSQKDPSFERNYQQAKEHNLRVGVYWYSYARNLSEAKQEAECFKQVIAGKDFDFGVWVDLETDDWKTDNGNPSGEMQAKCANLIAEEMKKAGYQVGLYSYTSAIDNLYHGLDIINFPLWEAQYNANDGFIHSDVSHRAIIHQYTSKWHLDGRYYDRNVCYKDIFKDSGKVPKKGVEGAVYRLYNPNNGDHLYTTNYFEATGVYMAGWAYEGIAWVSPSDGEPVYRLINPNNGTHVFVPKKEKDDLIKLGWTQEGIAFYSKGDNPIYRMYNPNGGEHILTADLNEHNGLTKIGWTCEGQELKYEK